MSLLRNAICLGIFFHTAILFSDTSAQWISRAPMPTPRQEVPHVALDGRIYVPAGLIQGGATNIVEAFEPASNSWASIASLPNNLHHVAAAAVDGKVYVMGGYLNSTFNETNLSFAYDPGENMWSPIGPMPQPRGAGMAVTFAGKIYVIGGTVNGSASNLNQVYDPDTNLWSSLAAMPTRREHLAAALVDSLIYVVGGRDFGFGGPGNYRRLEAYSPASNSWTTLPEMPTARGGLAAAEHNGLLYVFGGEVPGVFDENEVFDPASNNWTTAPPMPTARHGMGAATIGDTIFVIGGGLIAGLRTTDVNEGFVPSPPSSVDSHDLVPTSISLSQNYPNPFNPTTHFRITLAKAGQTRLEIFDTIGRRKATVIDKHFEAGEYVVDWAAEEALPSGVYFARLSLNGNPVVFRKLTLLK